MYSRYGGCSSIDGCGAESSQDGEKSEFHVDEWVLQEDWVGMFLNEVFRRADICVAGLYCWSVFWSVLQPKKSSRDDSYILVLIARS